MSEKKVLSTVTKTLIKNVIKHTDSHNKVLEESGMWRQRDRELEARSSFLKDHGVNMKYEFSTTHDRRAHMDEEPNSKSNYWMKELYKAEEADKDRWGHSGFKELYPDEFDCNKRTSSRSDESRHKNHDIYKWDHSGYVKLYPEEFDSDESSSTSGLDESSHKRHRDKYTSSKKVKKKKSRKRKRSSSDCDSESEVKQHKRKKTKHKEKKKKRKHKKRRHKSDSDSS